MSIVKKWIAMMTVTALGEAELMKAIEDLRRDRAMDVPISLSF